MRASSDGDKLDIGGSRERHLSDPRLDAPLTLAVADDERSHDECPRGLAAVRPEGDFGEPVKPMIETATRTSPTPSRRVGVGSDV